MRKRSKTVMSLGEKGSGKVRCAVIGLGMGRYHARQFAGFEDTELVAVADVALEKRAQARAEFPGVATYADHREMLAGEKPDLVTVALPNFLHKEVTVEALRSGCHVLCEKPMAMTVEEALEMRSVAEETGRILGVNLSQLFNPTTETLRQWVAGGELGEVYHGFVSWTRQDWIPGFGNWFGQKAKSGGGPLIDIGVHRIGLALHILGNPQPVRVSGFTQHHFGIPRAREAGVAFDVEDFAGALIRFENGSTLFLEVSWDGFQEHKSEMDLRFHGTKGAIRHEAHNEPEKAYYFYGNKHGTYYRSRLRIPEDKGASSYRSFVDTVRSGKPFAGSAELGIHLQQIINALYRSAELGREVEVERG